MIETWSGEARNKKIQNGHRLIWHTTILSIWKARNDKILKNGTKQVEDMVEEIKVLSLEVGIEQNQYSSLFIL